MKYLLLLFALFSIFVSCEKDELISYDDKDVTSKEDLSLEQQMNEFIELKMKDVYLWADNVKDRNIDIGQDPSDFLTAMMYKEDPWSYLEITETATKANIDGYEMTFGYRVKFYQPDTLLPNVIGIVQYVYSGTPAADAGIRRGDMIVMNNGEYLSTSNYSYIVTETEVSLKTGFYDNDMMYPYDETYNLSAQKAVLNPILLDTILEVGDKKVGYFVYSQFIDNRSNSLSDLSEAIRKMKIASIDEFILDLRHNPGGMNTAAIRLASLLAPTNVVQSEEVLIYKQWNEKYQQSFQSTGNVKDYFDPYVLADNLNLDKMYILTGDWTASASEVILSGLRPYMEVISIGERTVGKDVGASQMLPKKELQKWTLWPITFSYTNSFRESVKGGIAPMFYVEEYDDSLPPFGSSEDIVLAKAIELINGDASVTSLQTLSQRTTDSWKLLEGDTKYLLLD